MAFMNLTPYFNDECTAKEVLGDLSGHGIQESDATGFLDRLFEHMYSQVTCGSIWNPRLKGDMDEGVCLDNENQAEDYARFASCQRW